MISRNNILRATVLAAIVAAASACSNNPFASTTSFSAKLSGAAEVPPNSTTGGGTVEVTLNKETNVLTWKVDHGGLTGPVTAAHFHGPALPGANAGVALPIPDANTNPMQGQAKLTPAQLADLTAGKWYVNLHTAAHPAGEVRGQVVKN
jgi:hypothetical protein